MTDRFDDEVETALAHPGMTYAMAEKVKKYPEWARQQLTAQGHQTAQRWRDEARERSKELAPQLDSVRDRYAEIEAALDNGSMSAVEAIEEMEKLRGRVGTEERRYNAIRATQDRAEAVHADPVGHVERLFDTYRGLADRRLTLADYLTHLESKGTSYGLGYQGHV